MPIAAWSTPFLLLRRFFRGLDWLTDSAKLGLVKFGGVKALNLTKLSSSSFAPSASNLRCDQVFLAREGCFGSSVQGALETVGSS